MARANLRCERLDARIAPAVAPTMAPLAAPLAPVVQVSPPVLPGVLSPPVVPVSPPGAIAHPVAGIGSGKYICTLQAGNIPTGFHFTGMMDTKGMGRVTIQASVYGVGYGSAPAGGRITLSSAKGSVTLELVALPQPRLARLPEWFRYRITNATGVYKGMKDAGTLRLARFADALPIRNGIRYCESGSFRLVI